MANSPTFLTFLALLAILLTPSCSSVTYCDCQTEAEKENPSPATIADCKSLYQGKEFQEIERELEKCGIGE